MNFSTKLKWQFIWNWMIHFFAMPRCNRPLWLWWLRWRSFRDLESLRQQEGVQTPKWTTSLGKVFEAFLILQNKIVFFCLNQNHLLGMRVSSSLWMASPRSWINSIIFGTSLSHASNNLVSGKAWLMTVGEIHITPDRSFCIISLVKSHHNTRGKP